VRQGLDVSAVCPVAVTPPSRCEQLWRFFGLDIILCERFVQGPDLPSSWGCQLAAYLDFFFMLGGRAPRLSMSSGSTRSYISL